MANSNTYAEGYGNSGTQITTYDNIQGTGLKLPVPTQDFINIRSPGKIERIFTTAGNSTVLYNQNKPQDLYLKGPMASQMFIYKNIEEGQRNKVTTVFQASRQDGTRVRKFLGSSAGTRFILKQLVLQGFQPFDETKVYNPASPIIAALRLASFGLVDRPTRHLDTNNIVGGLLGGSGLGSIARTVGGLFGGGGPAVPAPPRSSVASAASGGFGVSTFTSLLGGADRADQVVSPLARPDVRDLLRGQTATNAYNAPRYSKLVSSGGGSFFSKLLGGVGNFLQNNTLIGGIIPPKQPWSSKYRADEQTYDLYLANGKLFDVSGITPTKSNGSGIMSQLVSGVKNALGLGTTTKFTGLAAGQRFYHASVNRPSFQRYDKFINANGLKNYPASTGILEFNNVENAALNITSREVSSLTQEGTDRYNNPVLSGVNGKPTTQIKYTDVVKADRTNGTLIEQSDQLLNYKVLSLGSKTIPDTFVNAEDQIVKDIASNFTNALKNITGGNPIESPSSQYKYNTGKGYIADLFPAQFQSWVSNKDDIGFNYIKNVKSSAQSKQNPSTDITYEARFNNAPIVPTRTKRQILPTNNVDYVNNLNVLQKDELQSLYFTPDDRNGPDLVKFYFYDIVNEKYIPFNATVKGIQDSNTAEWETVEYLGRPDKLYYYKGFTREVNFSFIVNAHSIKELMPMWQRINYLVGLTRPSNYTLSSAGGFMVPPMAQLTLGDFYKNHFVVIKSCNINIPEDASWELIPESNTSGWSFGPGFGGAIKWGYGDSVNNDQNGTVREKLKTGSQGRYAQFPRTAEITIQMSVLEKDRPGTGKSIWGDAPVSIVDGNEVLDKRENVYENDFSKNVRYDVNYSQSS
jgi:hypothetical protein